MKNLSKKLLLSILSIALVVIALGTSTFAWFTLSNQASVGTFNAEVTAGEGMELSLDGTTWYSTIPATVMQAKVKSLFESIDLNDNNPILNVVTTAELPIFKKLNSAQDEYVDAIANKDFIQIEIFVRATKLNTVHVSSISLTGGTKSWTPDQTFKGADGNDIVVEEGTPPTQINVHAENAARIGIRGIINITEFIFSNFVYENPTTISSNTVLGGITSPASFPTNGQASYFIAKNGYSPNIGTTTLIDVPTSVATSVTAVPTTFDASTSVLTLEKVGTTDVYTGNFDLFVWFEGFDPDTYNSVSGLALNVSLGFTGTLIP